MPINLTESEVNITTPDGVADAFFVHPASGTAPGVVMWTDIFGLRDAFRQMATRLAGEGYSVLVANPFYRVKHAPTSAGPNQPVEEVRPISGHLNETTHFTDARAFLTWLDQQPSVAKDRKMGAQGYCFGGHLAFRTAAAVPDRVGAVACFHGGRLVTDQPTSPHRQAAATEASFLVAVAQNDDEKEPTAKDAVRETLAAAGRPAEIEVYTGAMHGWCVLDSKVYNEAAAEKAWFRLLSLYGKALA
jgi:carboxymethylenebutenolidase